MHISQQRLELERNGWDFVITYTVDVHIKTFFNISIFFQNFKKFQKLKKDKTFQFLSNFVISYLSQEQLEIEQHRLNGRNFGIICIVNVHNLSFLTFRKF